MLRCLTIKYMNVWSTYHNGFRLIMCIPCEIQSVEIVSSCALEFAVPISYSVDVLSGMMGDVWIDALAGVEVLADANSNVFASLMTALEFAVPKPL